LRGNEDELDYQNGYFDERPSIFSNRRFIGISEYEK
jgi:hypothetical protein